VKAMRTNDRAIRAVSVVAIIIAAGIIASAFYVFYDASMHAEDKDAPSGRVTQALLARGEYSQARRASILLLDMTSPGMQRSRRQLAGLCPKACPKSLLRCDWSEKPVLKAISLNDAALFIMRPQAFSKRLLVT
jgi:hypothetical protein